MGLERLGLALRKKNSSKQKYFLSSEMVDTRGVHLLILICPFVLLMHDSLQDAQGVEVSVQSSATGVPAVQRALLKQQGVGSNRSPAGRLSEG